MSEMLSIASAMSFIVPRICNFYHITDPVSEFFVTPPRPRGYN